MQRRRGIPASSRPRGPDDGLGKDVRLSSPLCTKGSGPGKTLCDTEKMSYECPLSGYESEIGGIKMYSTQNCTRAREALPNFLNFCQCVALFGSQAALIVSVRLLDALLCRTYSNSVGHQTSQSDVEASRQTCRSVPEPKVLQV